MCQVEYHLTRWFGVRHHAPKMAAVARPQYLSSALVVADICFDGPTLHIQMCPLEWYRYTQH